MSTVSRISIGGESRDIKDENALENIADSVKTINIVNDAVTGPKICDGSIVIEHLADDFALTGDFIAEDTISAEHLKENAVTTLAIEDAAITPEKLDTEYVSKEVFDEAKKAWDSVSQTRPNILDDRIWFKFAGTNGHDLRLVFNWGNGKIYIWDQTEQEQLLEVS